MGHGALVLNFFPVRFPDAHLPFLLRPKEPEDTLLRDEIGWVDVSADYSARQSDTFRKPRVTTALALGPRDAAYDYKSEFKPWTKAPPNAIRALISRGLADELTRRDLDIDSNPVGFHCFEQSTLDIHQGAPVTLTKGVHFRVDHLVTAAGRIYGFFVSPATRLNITPDMSQEALLRRAAQGERVEYEIDGRVRRGTLQSIDRGTAHVLDASGEMRLSAQDIRVIPTAGTISRYFELKGQPDAARAVRIAPQIAQHRLLPSGRRNRSWLRDQFHFCINWLVSHSDYGRLLFRWPHSDIEISLATQPLPVTEPLLR